MINPLPARRPAKNAAASIIFFQAEDGIRDLLIAQSTSIMARIQIVNELTQGRILITGGAGFIGSALIWALNKLGLENILISDQLSNDEKWLNLAPLKFDDYIAADTLLKKVDGRKFPLKEIAWVFHLGACSSTTERDVGYLMENNYHYTAILCEWALQI